MSDPRKISVISDDRGFFHVYVDGTDIELYGILSCSIVLKPGNIPVAQIEIAQPEVEIKPRKQVKP